MNLPIHAGSSSGGTASAATNDLVRLLGYLQADPDNDLLRIDVFERAMALAEFATAQAQTQWALSRAPFDFAWRHRMAVLAMAQQNWSEAESLLRSLIDEGQTDPVLQFNLAYTYSAQGRHESAVALLEPIVSARSESLPQALTLLLRGVHAQQAMTKGIALFEQQIARQPLPDSYGAAGLLALDGGRLELAEKWSSTALAQDPNQHEALVTQASLRLAQRDGEGARALLDRALAQHPGDGRTWSAVGLVRLQALDFASARQAFQNALVGIPRHIGTWHGLGWCELFRQDLPAARAAFEQAIALDPNFGESHGGLAVVLALQNHPVEADVAMRRARGLDPSGLAARYAKAILTGEIRDVAGFARIAQAALAKHQDASGRSLADVVMGQRGQ